ncbi:MAG: hypothetical protein WBW49_03540, partial [Candidatus Acidiferrum sp.]
MERPWEKVSNIARAYLWSLVIWAGFSPIMAAQQKVLLLSQDRIHASYWQLLLVCGAWQMTSALLTPPIFYIVRRYPIARPASVRRIAGYVLGVLPYLVLSACLR